MPKPATRSGVTFATALALALASVPAHAQDAPADTATPRPRVTRPPRLVHFVEARFPEAERAAGRAATVVLQIQISATGAVDSVTVATSAGPDFDAAAMDAARAFVFEPAEIDGHTAPVRITYRYAFTLQPEAPTTGVFAGVVRRRGAAHAPLADVTVALDEHEHAVTDAQGRFRFDAVAPGHHAVALSGAGITPAHLDETIEAGHQLDATYDVAVEPPRPRGAAADGDEFEVVVRAPAVRRAAASTVVSADQARRVPGTQGDVLRVVENLPGVARASAGSGALIVWGSAPQDTRVYVDGVPVPRLYHDSGLRSVLPTEFVAGVELVPGGYGPAYGRGLGGVVLAESRTLDRPGFHATVALDPLDASAGVEAAIGPNAHVAVSARRSHLDSTLGLVEPNPGDYFPVPHYYDAQARFGYRLGPRESFDVTLLASSDQTSHIDPSSDPTRYARQDRALAFYRLYARYRHVLADGTTVAVTPFVGYDLASSLDQTGSVATTQGSSVVLAGVRASWRSRLARWFTLETGVDAEVNNSSLTRNGSIGAPPREGDLQVFGQPQPDQIAADRWSVATVGVAPYADADIALFGQRLHLEPGLRLDPYARSVSRRTPELGQTPRIGLDAYELRPEPRATLRWTPHRAIALRAAWGLYHQFPQAQDLSAAFGNPALPTAQAQHAVAGASVAITPALSLEATGFFETSSGLAVRNPLEAPAIAQALVATGEGRAYGAQVLLRQQLFHNFFGWVSYTLMRSERRDGSASAWRLFDYDQTHVLTVVASYRLPLAIEVGVRFRVASGYPRTPVLGSYYDTRLDRFEPVFGTQNASRLPTFVQLDARIARDFRIGATTLALYLDVQNVTNQQNPEEIVYNFDYSRSGYITGLPLLPLLGARWTL